jgi:dipeptidyl aminopeptidase/acylaminoacyl peptidase
MPPARFSQAIRVTCFSVLAIAAASSALSATAAAPPPAEAFATLPVVSEVVLAPGGNLIAWREQAGTDALAVIYDLAARKALHKIAVGKKTKLRSLVWADDETLLIELSQTDKIDTAGGKSYEIFRTLAIDVASGKGHILLMTSGSRQAVTSADLISSHTTKPKKVVMSTLDYSEGEARSDMDTRLAGHREDSGWVAYLFEVDTVSGKGTVIEQGSQFTEDWIVDKNGDCVARSEWNPKQSVYRVLAKNGSGWRELYSQRGRGDIALHGLTADGVAIVATGARDTGRRVAWTIPLDSGGLKVLYEDATYDVESVINDRYNGAPIGIWLGGPEEPAKWFDAAAGSRFASVQRAFKDRSVIVYGRSADSKRVLARVESPSHPPIYYLVDFTKKTADIVGDEYPALADVPLGEVSAISYKARDGTSIPAYLTIPPGTTGKNLPLVVVPHGGPEARDSYEFYWLTQFLATRGYAVLQPQFRGSVGNGDAFRLAGYKQWGGLMQDDVTDGVQAMIEQGVADAKRICIVGASYGGYAALAGATFTPDLYKCAVSVAGVSDLPDMLGSVKENIGDESNSIAYWKESIGEIYDKALIPRSPARMAANVRIPVLLLHGEDDTVVPIAQSKKMARELGKLGKPVTFVRLDGEDHWLSRGETRLQVLKEIEKFLAANL